MGSGGDGGEHEGIRLRSPQTTTGDARGYRPGGGLWRPDRISPHFCNWGCLGLDDVRALAVTVGMTTSMKLAEARRAAGIWSGEAVAKVELVRLIDEAGKALETRDEVVLARWYRDPETTHLFRKRLRLVDGIPLISDPVPLSRFAADASHIYDAGIEIENFLETHGL